MKQSLSLFLVGFIGISAVNGSGDSCTQIRGGIPKLLETVVDVITDKDQAASVESGNDSSGTGFIISEDGLVVTNNHVIGNAEKIKIILPDGREYQAKELGHDNRVDIALLKIDVHGKLPFVSFADSDKAQVGDRVIAIGNPFGFGQTVTSGIISYKGRNLFRQISELGAGGDLVSYLQTDAAVNYGNSGCPLFDYNGEVVGVITVFFADGIHNAGINFAIPSNTVKSAVQELKDNGKIQRSWIGISVVALSKNVVRVLGLGNLYGCAVTKVDANSPAAVAGVRTGDILTSINDTPIFENTNPEQLLNSLPIGKTVTIQVVRKNVSMKFYVTVGLRSDDDFYLGQRESAEKQDIPYEKIEGLDVGVSNMSVALRKSFDVPDSVNGPVVIHSGPVNGLSIGDVIQSVNQMEVKCVEDLKSSLLQLAKDSNVKKCREVAVCFFSSQGHKWDYTTVPYNPGGKFSPKITITPPTKAAVPKNIFDKIKDGIERAWQTI
ncbi:MAG: trypsin-like peptidase domain-containing protein [Holosporaceae bacterium]|nr:trypsin-like peptidase domain-containing protein [Holosporaceae bacterium]